MPRKNVKQEIPEVEQTVETKIEVAETEEEKVEATFPEEEQEVIYSRL